MFSVCQAHQIQTFAIDLILRIKRIVKLHDLKDGGHCLVVEALSIHDILDSPRHLIEADQDLPYVLQIAVVLSSQPLELFAQPIFSLPRLFDHVRQIMLQLQLCLCDSHYIGGHIIVVSFQRLSFGDCQPLAQLYDLIGHLFHEAFHVTNFSICQQINSIYVTNKHFLRIGCCLCALNHFGFNGAVRLT